MVNRVLPTLIIAPWWFSTQASAITFNRKGTSIIWASSSSRTASGGPGDYSGQAGRTTDIARIAISGAFINQPALTSSVTIAPIELGCCYQAVGMPLTVCGTTDTATTITRDNNTTGDNYIVFDYLHGTGTISFANINIGGG